MSLVVSWSWGAMNDTMSLKWKSDHADVVPCIRSVLA